MKKYKAEITAYYPSNEGVEGGFYDAFGNKLDTNYNTCACPKEIPFYTKIKIENTGTKYDGQVYECLDRGSAIVVDDDGVYHIDLLMKNKEEANLFGRRKNSNITIIGDEDMKFLVGLDDGHGMETAGKRTCKLKSDIKFRGKTFKKGSFIHENDFNENLMELLEKELDRCGIGHIQLAQGDTDISLASRVKKANTKKCDLVVSLHANALSGDKLQEKAFGLVVIHHVNCQSKTKTLAKNCYKYLSKEVGWYSTGATKYGVRADTDISGFSLYILKNTNAPAVLIEYGFMDNWEDVKIMCSDKFQNDCARATAKGICDSLGVKYVSSTITKPPTSSPDKPDTNKVIYRVVCGSYSTRENAEAEIKKLKKLGYSSFIDIFKKDNKNYYRVVAGSYSVKDNADKLVKELKGKGYSPFIAN